jgi:hypothetical protein
MVASLSTGQNDVPEAPVVSVIIRVVSFISCGFADRSTIVEEHLKYISERLLKPPHYVHITSPLILRIIVVTEFEFV